MRVGEAMAVMYVGECVCVSVEYVHCVGESV